MIQAKIGAMEYIRELSSFWHKYDYVCKRGRRKDFSPVADIHHEVLPWHFFCLLFFLSFSQQTWYRTEAGNCHALFSASNPWQSLKWDWQRRKKAIERCVLLMSRPFKAVVFVVPLPLPPKNILRCVSKFFFALFLADVTAQRFPDLKMSPGQLWILFVVTGKCLTPGPHKKVGALKFWALKQETQTFFSIIETSFLSDFCCLKKVVCYISI